MLKINKIRIRYSVHFSC